MKILIVEDSKFAQVIQSRLFFEFFPDSEVFLASNGIDGYHEFLRLRPDVVVTDLLMPQMNGQEMVAKIREIDKNVVIFTVTADIQQATKEELDKYGVTGFINKPLDKNKMAVVKRIMEERLHAE